MVWFSRALFLAFFSNSLLIVSIQGGLIDKIFFHTGILSDKLVLYCAQDTVCTRWPEREANSVEFFMPSAKLNSSASGMLDALKSKIESGVIGYVIDLTCVKKPVLGVKVSFKRDPRFFAIELERFSALGGAYGLAFTVTKKNALKELEKANEPLLVPALAKDKMRPLTVVVDPGHGGVDCGAVSSRGIYEKDVVLSLARKVKELLCWQGYRVILTRSDDRFVQLDERTHGAYLAKADLFVSLHCNADPKKRASGIETWWAGADLFKSEFTALDPGLQEHVKVFKMLRDGASASLGHDIQLHCVSAVRQYLKLSLEGTLGYEPVIDRGVRKGVAQVLMGTEIPAVLVEVGFLSSQHEARRLEKSSYLDALASGIVQGIRSFVSKQIFF